MPRRIFTQEDYQTLVDAFRKVPGNVRGASRLANVAPATARRGWHQGWPERGQKPIKDVLAEEAATVRRRLEEAAERERKLEERERALRPLVDGERERLDAIARREDWARSCSAARHNAQTMLETVGKLLDSAFARSELIRGKLAELDLTPQQWLRITRDLVSAGKTVTEALHLALQTEHLALGQPTDIVGLAPMSMSLEEAREEIRLAQRAIARAAERRGDGPVLDAEFSEVLDRVAPGPAADGARNPSKDPLGPVESTETGQDVPAHPPEEKAARKNESPTAPQLDLADGWDLVEAEEDRHVLPELRNISLSRNEEEDPDGEEEEDVDDAAAV